MILNCTAKRLGLKGEDVILTLRTVNGDESLETKLFDLELFDRTSMKHPIKAFGVPNILGIITSTDLRRLKQSFSLSMQRIWKKVES